MRASRQRPSSVCWPCLIVCCIIIYGMVMIFPAVGITTRRLEGQVTSDFYDLVAVLERNGWETSSDSLMEFSMRNNASVEINDIMGIICSP